MASLHGRPWMSYERISSPNASRAGSLLTMSLLSPQVSHGDNKHRDLGLADQGNHVGSPEFNSFLFGQEASRDSRRSHTSVIWWTPDVLSLTGGMVCLMGHDPVPSVSAKLVMLTVRI
jgi:hypothetical protein